MKTVKKLGCMAAAASLFASLGTIAVYLKWKNRNKKVKPDDA